MNSVSVERGKPLLGGQAKVHETRLGFLRVEKLQSTLGSGALLKGDAAKTCHRRRMSTSYKIKQENHSSTCLGGMPERTAVLQTVSVRGQLASLGASHEMCMVSMMLSKEMIQIVLS